jgi:hypothetical protein
MPFLPRRPVIAEVNNRLIQFLHHIRDIPPDSESSGYLSRCMEESGDASQGKKA